MKYWLDLFSWKTWNEFLEAGANVSGFRQNRWKTVRGFKPGDLLLCYMTGISRFFAILEIKGKPYIEDSPIWEDDPFPCRVPVEVALALDPEYAVPVKSLSDQLSYFQNMKSPHSWTGHFRGSPTEEKQKDAQAIIAALRDAYENPVEREYDSKKLDRPYRKVYQAESDTDTVTIPENDDFEVETAQDEYKVTHEEIQWLLLYLGSQMGLELWIARNDKGRSYQGQPFQDIPGILETLPVRFNEATNRIIELIDVLWLEEDNIIAAFEVEHTSSVYSELLRLSDLVAMQPNIKIQLFIVAPDERREKVFNEIDRPTFSKALKTPLREMCQYISYSSLREELERAGDLVQYLRPNFLEKIAESFEDV